MRRKRVPSSHSTTFTAIGSEIPFRFLHILIKFYVKILRQIREFYASKAWAASEDCYRTRHRRYPYFQFYSYLKGIKDYGQHAFSRRLKLHQFVIIETSTNMFKIGIIFAFNLNISTFQLLFDDCWSCVVRKHQYQYQNRRKRQQQHTRVLIVLTRSSNLISSLKWYF